LDRAQELAEEFEFVDKEYRDLVSQNPELIEEALGIALQDYLNMEYQRFQLRIIILKALAYHHMGNEEKADALVEYALEQEKAYGLTMSYVKTRPEYRELRGCP
jgi:hypothetical protein